MLTLEGFARVLGGLGVGVGVTLDGFARVGSTTNDEASALSKLWVDEAPLYRPCSTALLGERTWLGSRLGLGLGLGLG